MEDLDDIALKLAQLKLLVAFYYSSDVHLTPREESNLQWELEEAQLKFDTLLEYNREDTGEWDE